MIEVREVTPKLWPDILELFGKNGACGGCWCMYWRIEKGEKWDKIKGEEAQKRFQKGILSGEIFGALAYIDEQPVGWCTFGPRHSFSRLDRSPSFKCDDASKVWSIPCFYIKSGNRGKGVATALLEKSLSFMKKKGAGIIEGYPSKPGKDGKYVAAFAWTGTQSLFSKAGFNIAGNEDGGKQRVRITHHLKTSPGG